MNNQVRYPQPPHAAQINEWYSRILMHSHKPRR